VNSTAGKPKFLYAFLDAYFYVTEKFAIFGVLKKKLWNTVTEIFQTRKLGLFRESWEEWDLYF
jgi:hypothetical protein